MVHTCSNSSYPILSYLFFSSLLFPQLYAYFDRSSQTPTDPYPECKWVEYGERQRERAVIKATDQQSRTVHFKKLVSFCTFGGPSIF